MRTSDFDRYRAMTHDELETMQRRNWTLSMQAEPSPEALRGMLNAVPPIQPTMTLAKWDKARAAYRPQ